MKPKLNLAFLDTFQPAVDFWKDTLSKRYELVLERKPKLVIFGDSNFGTDHRQVDRAFTKKLFYTGENVRPNWNECNWACTFDHENSPRHYRLPLYVIEMHEMVSEGYPKDFLYKEKNWLGIDEEYFWNRKFCSFVQSNPNVPERNSFFHALTSRLTVDSGGPLFNNIGRVINRPGGHQDKIDFISQYKFNIAFENGSYSGYVTEKLLNAFYANTVPIYWGSEKVGRDFNKRAFIDSNDFYNEKELIDYVLEVNADKKKYLDILTQPCFTDNRVNEYANIDNLLDWFDYNVYKGLKNG